MFHKQIRVALLIASKRLVAAETSDKITTVSLIATGTSERRLPFLLIVLGKHSHLLGVLHESAEIGLRCFKVREVVLTVVYVVAAAP